MRFALFYEIPVARPWGPDSEQHAYQQHHRAGGRRRAVGLGRLLDRRAPLPRGVLALLEPRGALRRHRRARPSASASATACGSCPSPTTTRCARAESVAVLDLISNGRVDFGTGRSSTRAELEGFGIDPAPDPGHVAGGHRAHRRLLDQRRVRVRRRVLADAASAGCCPSPCSSRTRRCGARPAARTATAQVGRARPRACARSPSACPPEEVKEKIDIYREAVRRLHRADRRVRPRRGRHLHDDAVRARPATRPWTTARESFEWYPKAGARLIGAVAEWMAETQQDLGTYALRRRPQGRPTTSGALDLLTLEYLVEIGRLRARHARRLRRDVPAATRRPASTCCCASSTRTRSPTRRSCRRSS